MRRKLPNGQARQILLLAVGVCLVLGLMSCGGSGNSSHSLSIAFAAVPLAPPSSLGLANVVSVAAVVNGDPGGQGVNWTVTCVPGTGKNATCGSVTAHTASGYPTTYTAPTGTSTPTSYIPVGGTVTLTATSTADTSKTISATIQITLLQPIVVGFNTAPPASMLTGGTANLVAVVNFDSTNAGVDFVLTCATPGSCGSVAPSHTDGQANSPAVFTAPLAVPIDGLDNTVTITAVSTADPTKSAFTTVAITQASVAIALSQLPPPSLPAGASTSVTAVVTLDPFNAGVDWILSCQSTQSGACGSLSLTHTASGQSTTYTAPSSPPFGNTVFIGAASSTSPDKVVSATVNVTPLDLRDDLLNGRYAFLLKGVREGGPWAIAGSLVADGIGNITLATERFPGDNNTYSLSGSYFIQSDGTGTITLNGAPNGLGYWHNGQQVFKLSVENSSPGLIAIEEFDGYYDTNLHVPYGGTLTGTLEQQSVADFKPLSSLSSYSFLLSGSAPQNSSGFYGGVLNGNSFNFTMDRSITGVVDSISGQISFISVAPDGGSGTVLIGPYSFGYFVVDSGNWILIAGAGSTDFPAGHLFLQPSAPTVPVGNFAFTEAGATPLAQGSSPLALGGTFSSDALGNVSGWLDANVNGALSSGPVTGAMLVTSSGPAQGRGTLTLTGGGAQQFAVYPTAAHGVLMLQLDPQASGVGTALPQTTGSSATASLFSGKYTAAFQTLGTIDGTNGGVGSWNDSLGLLTADGVSSLVGSVALDQFDESSHAFWTQTPAAPVTGSFTPGPQGRFTGSLSTPPLAASQQMFYILDGSTVLSLGLDSGPATGILHLQQF